MSPETPLHGESLELIGELRRIGNFFALAVKLLLSAPVWFSFTQWLWRTLKHKAMSVKALDTAFGAETSVLLKLNVGVLLILLAWWGPRTMPLRSGLTVMQVSSSPAVDHPGDLDCCTN